MIFPLLRSLRPHQWSKNLLLLLPAAAAHRALDGSLGVALLQAVASFSLLASALYLVNDVADADHDRAHPTKRTRPVASGELVPGMALGAAAVLVAGSAALALPLPRPFLWAWGAYLVMSASYSAGLKRLVVLDVILLAALYTVRVVAGAAAVDVPLSRWFLAFSVFVFTSLALLKRAVEAGGTAEAGGGDTVAGGGHAATGGEVDAVAGGGTAPAHSLRGRGWRTGDLPVLAATGIACAVAAALVYCLYITGEDVLRLYSRPDLLWLGLPVLLYWLVRAWLLALRGEVHDDPVVFALKDPAGWASGLVLAVTVWLAT